MPEVSPRVLVVAYGNPLRGDDGVGAAIASALAPAAAEHVDVLICHQLTPELAECIAAVDLVVFIDAQLGGAPGSIAVSSVPHDATTHSTPLVHHMNPNALVSMAAALFGRAPSAFIVTVSAGSFELNEGLSERVALAVPEAIEVIRQLIANELHGA